MRLKDESVNVNGMHPDVWRPLFKLDTYWKAKFKKQLVLTSCRDGKHSKTSDHHWGGGIDLRTWSVKNRKETLSQVKILLGKNWYVLDEKDHFHLSYRPRSP